MRNIQQLIEPLHSSTQQGDRSLHTFRVPDPSTEPGLMGLYLWKASRDRAQPDFWRENVSEATESSVLLRFLNTSQSEPFSLLDHNTMSVSQTMKSFKGNYQPLDLHLEAYRHLMQFPKYWCHVHQVTSAIYYPYCCILHQVSSSTAPFRGHCGSPDCKLFSSGTSGRHQSGDCFN